jgi:hypothetical protein
MKPFMGIRKNIPLRHFAFDLSLLGQDEKLNLYLFLIKLYSGLDENPRGNLRYKLKHN